MKTEQKKIFKMLTAILISFTVVIGSFPSQSLAGIDSKDLQGHWSEVAIEKCSAYGIISGDNGYFRPQDPITRAEFATMVNKAFNFTETKGAASFTDVPENAWYAKEIKIASALGYMNGVSDGKAAPNSKITREQAFTILAKVYKLAGGTNTYSPFTDSSQISDYAKTSIAALATAGYINGRNGRIDPKATITRGETAQILVGIFGEIADNDIDGGQFQNLTVRRADVTVKNAVIDGDLFITDGVGTGSVTLENVTVKGRTLITGGGSDSVRIYDSNLKNVITDSRHNTSVDLSQNTNAAKVYLNSPTQYAIYKNETIGYDIESNTVTFNGGFDKITLNKGESVTVVNGKNIYDFVLTNSGADAPKLTFELTQGTVVKLMILNAPVNITGTGEIKKLEMHARDVVIGKDIIIDPNNIKADSGIEFLIGDKPYVGIGTKSTPATQNPTGGGSGGSGGGSSGGGSGGGTTPTPPSTTPTITPITLNPSGAVSKNIGDNFDVTISGGVLQNAGSNTAVLSVASSNTSVATVSAVSGGKFTVTPVSTGSAAITVTASYTGAQPVSATINLTVNSTPTTTPTITPITLNPSGAVSKNIGDNFDVTISGGVLQNAGSNTAVLSVASSNTSVATVSAVSGGKFTVTPVSAGSAAITVTASYTGAQPVNATINLTVNSTPTTTPTITPITLNPSGAVSKNIGDNFDVTISGGVLQNAGSNTAVLSVTSSNTSVATVSAVSGGKFTVTPVSAGSAAITVTASYTGAQPVSATINLTVNAVVDEVFQGVYYVSNSEGNDSNTGFSASSPWKTLDKVTQQTFAPGDKILFKAGDVWDGQRVRFHGSGTSGKPIVVDQYGSGAKPRFNGNGTTTEGWTYTHGEVLFTNTNDTINTISATVELWEGSYWTINNLEITNYRQTEDSVRAGIAVMDSARTKQEYIDTPSQSITIQNCYIHDVNSIFEYYVKRSGGIVIFGNYNNVIIDSNRIENVAVSGIRTVSASHLAGSLPIYPLKNHVFSNNILKNIAGDGIVMGGVENGKIEYNWLDRACCVDGGAYTGIWTYSCKDIVIQYNEVSNTVYGGQDGQAFMVSSYNDNILIQYNYTHGNNRAVITFTGRDNESSAGTVFRYNVSVNDSVGKYVTTANMIGIYNKDLAERTPLIYNNLIYRHSSLPQNYLFSNYPLPDEVAIYENLHFKLFNNIIVLQTNIGFTNRYVSSGNIAYNLVMPYKILTNARTRPAENWVIHDNIEFSGKLFDDIIPGNEPSGIITGKNQFNAEALSMFKPASDSPAIGAGTVITEELLGSQLRETTDFFGNAIDPKGTVSIGVDNSFRTNAVITPITLNPSGAVSKNIGDNFDVTISGGVLQNAGSNTAVLSVASSNTSVATVSAVSGGKFTVTPVSAGSATVTVTASYTGTQSVSATLNLTVNSTPLVEPVDNSIAGFKATGTELYNTIKSSIEVEEQKAGQAVHGDYIDVTEYGVVGDGSTENADTFRNALKAAMISGKPLYFPDGTYNLAGYSNPNYNVATADNNLTIIGQSSANTKIINSPRIIAHMDVKIENISVTSYESYFIWLSPADYHTLYINNVNFSGDRAETVFVGASQGDPSKGYSYIEITNCEVTECRSMISIRCAIKSGLIEKNIIHDLGIPGERIVIDGILLGHQDTSTGVNITTAPADDVLIRNNYLKGFYNERGETLEELGYDNSMHGILVYGQNVTIEGNYLEDIIGGRIHDGIYTKGEYGIIRNNTLYNAGDGQGSIVSKGHYSQDGRIIIQGNRIRSDVCTQDDIHSGILLQADYADIVDNYINMNHGVGISSVPIDRIADNGINIIGNEIIVHGRNILISQKANGHVRIQKNIFVYTPSDAAIDAAGGYEQAVLILKSTSDGASFDVSDNDITGNERVFRMYSLGDNNTAVFKNNIIRCPKGIDVFADLRKINLSFTESNNTIHYIE